MEKKIVIINDPIGNQPRAFKVNDFNWNIDKDKIDVPGIVIFMNPQDISLENPEIPIRHRTLTVDNKDRIDLTTGNMVYEKDYDPEIYPTTIGQYDGMMSMSVIDAFERIATLPGNSSFATLRARLQAAGITEFEKLFKDFMLDNIEVNVVKSSADGKLNIS